MNDPRENPGCQSSKGHTSAEATEAPEVWLSGAFLGTGVWLPPFSSPNTGFHLMHCLNFIKPFMCTTSEPTCLLINGKYKVEARKYPTV